MSTALIVFAKAPVAGQVKTRLIPALGAEGAAQLAQRLVSHALQQVGPFAAAHRELCVAPDASHPAFTQAMSGGAWQLTGQGPGDLGERMHRALERVLRSHRQALLMGTDAPALDAARLAQADAALHTHDAVFVPALDGGYALVGLKRPAPELFAQMRWSHAQVLAHTLERAHRAQLRCALLSPVPDIDEPADLVHLPASWRVPA